jgi:hypothetical protein
MALQNLLKISIIFVIFKIIELKPCKENTIIKNVDNADIIIAGVVKNVVTNRIDPMYGSYIKINRIIKGHNYINEILNIKFNKIKLIKKSLHNSLYNDNQNDLINSSFLFVKNFGHESICVSHLNVNEAGIFLLRINKKKELFLNSSIIKIIYRKNDQQITLRDGKKLILIKFSTVNEIN